MRSIRIITIAMIAGGLLAGSAVGAAAQSAIVRGGVSSGDTCEMAGEGVEFCTGGRFEFDDPRLTGDYELTRTLVTGGEGLQEEAMIATEDFRVTNAEGAWSGQYVMGYFLKESEFLEDAEPEPVSGGNNWLLVGEGAYEGLMAWVYLPYDGGRTEGLILDGPPLLLEAESIE